MKVVVRATVVEGGVRQAISRTIELPAPPSVGDKFRLVGGYTDEGTSTVAGRYWLADGTLEVLLDDVEGGSFGMSSSILAGQGWELRG